MVNVHAGSRLSRQAGVGQKRTVTFMIYSGNSLSWTTRFIEASHCDAFIPKHGHETTTASRATALAEKLVDTATQPYSAGIDTPPPSQVSVITRSGDFEH